MNTASKTLLLLAGTLMSTAYAAEQPEEILKVKKSTFVNLVDLLVQRGVINKQEGQGLVSAAEQEAKEAPVENSGSNQTANPEATENQTTQAKSATSKSKHVSYVPEFVKQEIREQVRAELKTEVVHDVKQDAKTEGWGVPGALPEWVAAFHPSFDARIRLQDSFFDSGNASGPQNAPTNYLAINSLYLGGNTAPYTAAQARSPYSSGYAYLNNSKSQLLVRERFRLGFETDITEGLKAGIRFVTSNLYSPVSNDQTLGNTGQSYQFAIDRSYIQYDFRDNHKDSLFSIYGGRIINPFMSTDIVFDPDLSFEGVATSFRLHFNQNNPVVRGYQVDNPTQRSGINKGQQTPDSIFLTVGAFPIQTVNFSSSSKWLYAGQLGADWLVFDNARFNIATSYYDYENISARYNSAGTNGHEYDWTAPQFTQQGNSMVAITNQNSGPGVNTVCTDSVGCLFGLASGFRIFNATAIYDYLALGQTHVILTADYAKNLGFNQQQILQEFKTSITPRTTAYQVRLDVGQPKMVRFGDWNVSFAYRYVQRDSVLDAFTESQFHLGGTNAKGWVLATQYGLARNTWLDARWVSTDAIDGPTYSVDTLYTDFNTRF